MIGCFINSINLVIALIINSPFVYCVGFSKSCSRNIKHSSPAVCRMSAVVDSPTGRQFTKLMPENGGESHTVWHFLLGAAHH